MPYDISIGVPERAASYLALMQTAIMIGAAPKYSEAEREAWCAALPQEQVLSHRLQDQKLFESTDQKGAVMGFVSVTQGGELDFLYVAPEARQTGLADQLLINALNQAALSGHKRLETKASTMARPFFLRHGWEEGRRQNTYLGKECLTAFSMSYDLLNCAA